MKYFALFFLALCVLGFTSALIHCNDRGICSGDGGPAEDTRCGNCHSCTYKNCCHVRFTNVNTKCDIPGWRSDAYNTVHG